MRKTRSVKGARKQALGPGKVKLKLRPRGKAAKRLSKAKARSSRKGRVKARVRAKLRYTPDGSGPREQVRRVKLIRVA